MAIVRGCEASLISSLFVAPGRQSSIPSLLTCFGEVELFAIRTSCERDKVAVGGYQVVVVILLAPVRDIDTRHSLIRHRSVTSIEFKIISQHTLYPIAWHRSRYSQTHEHGHRDQIGIGCFHDYRTVERSPAFIFYLKFSVHINSRVGIAIIREDQEPRHARS